MVDTLAATDDSSSESPQIVQEHLMFTVGGEVYGVPLKSVQQILRPTPVTGVPTAPVFVLGVITVRGRILTVVDPARRLNVTPAGEYSKFVIINNGEEDLALAVENVVQVYRLKATDIEYVTDIGGDISDFVIGIARPNNDDKDEQVFLLLDPVSLLRV